MKLINQYQLQHCSIIPIKPKSKLPYNSWKEYQSRRSSSEEIDTWYRKFPGCNWAMVTGALSGIVVVDFDDKEAYFDAQTRGLPDCPSVITPRGCHCYFKYSEGMRNFQARTDLPGVDFRGDGGYVLIPPSIHPDGEPYKWEPGCELGSMELVDPPEWLFVRSSNGQAVKELYKGVEEGKRNSSLARLMGSWANDGLSVDECLYMANAWNLTNKPPMPDDEVRRTVNSIYNRHYAEDKVDEVEISPPEEINNFLSREIPPVEFIVQDILQKGGRTMISAPPNIGKSLFVQNLAILMAQGGSSFVDRFDIAKVKVLYLDLEMGESALSQRFKSMLAGQPIENLYIRSGSDIDLLDEQYQRSLEEWIDAFGIEVLIIDPIGDAWMGDENTKQDVAKLTSYLDSVREKYGISILIVHHWRKRSKDFKRGGEMASGSYKWNAWLDTHITLEGADTKSVTLSCEKSRNVQKFEPLIIGVEGKDLTFSYKGEFKKKFDDSTVVEIYEACECDWVSVPDLCKMAVNLKICSKDTVRKLLKESNRFEIDKSEKTHKVKLKKNTAELFDAPDWVLEES